ncbi:hypothetical protein MMC25_003695 [Agyrium rufum]|nr:hypothetical protein [Agyrium rufum]
MDNVQRAVFQKIGRLYEKLRKEEANRDVDASASSLSNAELAGPSSSERGKYIDEDNGRACAVSYDHLKKQLLEDEVYHDSAQPFEVEDTDVNAETQTEIDDQDTLPSSYHLTARQQEKQPQHRSPQPRQTAQTSAGEGQLLSGDWGPYLSGDVAGRLLVSKDARILPLKRAYENETTDREIIGGHPLTKRRSLACRGSFIIADYLPREATKSWSDTNDFEGHAPFWDTSADASLEQSWADEDTTIDGGDSDGTSVHGLVLSTNQSWVEGQIAQLKYRLRKARGAGIESPVRPNEEYNFFSPIIPYIPHRIMPTPRRRPTNPVNRPCMEHRGRFSDLTKSAPTYPTSRDHIAGDEVEKVIDSPTEEYEGSRAGTHVGRNIDNSHDKNFSSGSNRLNSKQRGNAAASRYRGARSSSKVTKTNTNSSSEVQMASRHEGHQGWVFHCENSNIHGAEKHYVCGGCVFDAHTCLERSNPELFRSTTFPLCKDCSNEALRRNPNPIETNSCVCTTQRGSGRWLCFECKQLELEEVQLQAEIMRQLRTGDIYENSLEVGSGFGTGLSGETCCCTGSLQGVRIHEVSQCGACWGIVNKENWLENDAAGFVEELSMRKQGVDLIFGQIIRTFPLTEPDSQEEIMKILEY